MYTDLETGCENLLNPPKFSGYCGNYFKILQDQQCKNKLHLGFPKGTRLASKTGESLGIEHDVGVLFGQEDVVIIVVMTQDLSANYDGIELCRDVARFIDQNML